MDGIPIIDFSSLPTLDDVENLNKDQLKSVAEQFMNAFTTVGIVRLINTGLNDTLVGLYRSTMFLLIATHLNFNYYVFSRSYCYTVRSAISSMPVVRPSVCL